MGRKTSVVWNHFKIPELFPKKAICNYCLTMVGRGQKSMGTTSLINHLKRCQDFKATLGSQTANFSDSADDSYAYAGEEVPLGGASTDAYSDGESNPPSMSDTDINPLSPSDNEAAAPSLVLARRFGQEDGRTSHSNGRPSVLLCGDANSLSELSGEEQSDSNPKDLRNYMSSGSKMNFLYGGFMLHLLYEQYKQELYCDLVLVTQSQLQKEGTISETGKILQKNVTSCKEKTEIKVHTCLLAGMSKKISMLVSMGCTTIQLKKGNYHAVRGLMEILYTGKLGKIRKYSTDQMVEILEVAKFLEVDYAIKYITNELVDAYPKGQAYPEADNRSKPEELSEAESFVSENDTPNASDAALCGFAPRLIMRKSKTVVNRLKGTCETMISRSEGTAQRSQTTKTSLENGVQNLETRHSRSNNAKTRLQNNTEPKRQKFDSGSWWGVKSENSNEMLENHVIPNLYETQFVHENHTWRRPDQSGT